MVVCLEQGADLHMAQLMPLPLTVSHSSKIQIGFTFLVPAYPGCPGKEAVKWLLLLLDDLEGHVPNAGLIKCNLTNIYATFSTGLTDMACRAVPRR